MTTIAANLGVVICFFDRTGGTRGKTQQHQKIVSICFLMLLCFVLFCSEDRLVRVMEEVASREKCLKQSEELLQRFKKATVR